MTQEELEKQNKFLIERAEALQNQLNQMTSINNTLHWLFKAIKYRDAFKPEFVEKITNHVESMLTPPDDKQQVS